MKAWCLIFAAFVLLDSAATVCGQEPAKPITPGSLTLEEVLKWHQSKQTEELIITRIRRNGKPFDLNSDETAELQKMGLSENVVKYLLDPTLPYSPPPPPAPSSNTSVAPPPKPSKPPAYPIVLKVPPEIGLYIMDDPEKPLQLELKPIVVSKQPGKLGAKLTGGLLKGQTVGSIAGRAAKARVAANVSKVYARLGEKTAAEDLALVMMTKEDARRDLNFGPKPDKPAFPVSAVRQFESKDVGQGVLMLSLPKLVAGEYIFFILGSGEEKKGTLGKGWEFGVE